MIQTLFYEPIFNFLMFFYSYTGNLGVAILLLALFTRLITYPLTKRQIKNADKGQEMQEKMKALKKKFKKNQEKLAQEMAKLQAEYLPGQIGGCLNIIIALILLFQVRSVVINLVDQGVHAFNKVAYVESLKFDEDQILLPIDTDIKQEINTIRVKVDAANGNSVEKIINFAILGQADQSKLEEEIVNLNKKLEEDIENSKSRDDIGVYIEQLQNELAISNDITELTIFLRPPSNAKINYDTLEIYFNEIKLTTDQYSYSQGETLNMTFMGADLSKVASDYDIKDVKLFAPYLLIAISVGITQFFATKIQTGAQMKKKVEEMKQKKNDKKSANSKEDEPDLSEIMMQVSQQMTYVFPFVTIFMSLGYLGGANLFPTGVSLFWTGQNTFVIIQHTIMHKDEIKVKLLNHYSIIKNKIKS
jgi:YidC/Oxa1 family membrane protein insertase